MLDYVNEQKQRKSGQSDSLHTGFIPTTSRRRRKFRRTEKTDIGLCLLSVFAVFDNQHTRTLVFFYLMHLTRIQLN